MKTSTITTGLDITDSPIVMTNLIMEKWHYGQAEQALNLAAWLSIIGMEMERYIHWIHNRIFYSWQQASNLEN